jgi:hypothetical protein
MFTPPSPEAIDWNSRFLSSLIAAIDRNHAEAVRCGYEGKVVIVYNYHKPGVLNQTFDINNRIFRVEK